jgi:hypothetical protein
LNREKSPYLLQHVENPVDWYPWGREAFEKARAADKPVFLSIGYSTCHWCHVMAHESFEDEAVARILNESFVSVKVDREERPDVDMVYMAVCQATTLRGGWPLSIFMTPEGKPFYAGTYFPKTPRAGMPGFVQLLEQIAAAWQHERKGLLEVSEKIVRGIQPRVEAEPGQEPGLHTLEKAYQQFLESFDHTWGGFGSGPKFPTPHNLTFLLRWHRRSGEGTALQMVEKTLSAMRRGGIFDQIGFGFHRYSVDERWLVPHFEKMLYDQAMLAMAYSEAYQVTGTADYGRVAGEILTYVLRDMTAPEGAFYTAEDADSEGREGLFYLWTPQEIEEHLDRETAALFCRFYGVAPQGNFEDGRSILNIPIPAEEFVETERMSISELETVLEQGRQKLLLARAQRIHPLKDDKVLTSWNGLMIAAMARAHQALGHQAFVDAARRAAEFILHTMKRPGPRLVRRYRDGEVAHPGFAEDYAFLVWGLIELYETTFELRYLEEALALNHALLDLFWDTRNGGIFFSGRENESLIKRSKEIYDGALPSSNSVAVLNLVRLGRITGDPNLQRKAEEVGRAFAKRLRAYPSAYSQFLSAVDFMAGPSEEIVIVGERERASTRALVTAVHRAFRPNKVVLLRPRGEAGRLGDLAPFVNGLGPVEGESAVYVCRNHVCQSPLTEPEGLTRALD